MRLEELSDDIPPRPMRSLHEAFLQMHSRIESDIARISDEQLRQRAIGAILQVNACQVVERARDEGNRTHANKLSTVAALSACPGTGYAGCMYAGCVARPAGALGAHSRATSVGWESKVGAEAGSKSVEGCRVSAGHLHHCTWCEGPASSISAGGQGSVGAGVHSRSGAGVGTRNMLEASFPSKCSRK